MIYYTHLQYILPACSLLWPMRLVCTATVYRTVAKQPPEVVRAVRAVGSTRGGPSGPSGPLLIAHGTMLHHYNLATLARTSRTSKYGPKYGEIASAFTVVLRPLEAPQMFRKLIWDVFRVHKMLGCY